ncbi:MAG: TrkA C-terminal domain-containing protein [Bacilli bacterium]
MQEISIYQSIALDIAQRIANGEYPIATKLSGRSLLASQYRVSPETIRKAIGLLKEQQIVDVSQGKEIVVTSIENAHEYASCCGYLEAAYSLKNEITQLLAEKEKTDKKLKSVLSDIVALSDPLQNLTPYNPVEIEVTPSSHVIGLTIANIRLWQMTGATIIALRRNMNISISPGPHVILRKHDILVVVGDNEVEERTKKFINDADKIGQ